MATIREKRNRWHVQIRRKGYPVQTATFDTKSEAERWATVVESEMVRGVFVDRSVAESTTLYEALERYEREFSVRKDGHQQEKVRIASWKNHPLAKRSLANLRGTDFVGFRDARLKTVSPSTVQKDLAVISHLFTMARKEWGIAVGNPISDITIPTEDNSRNRRLEADEEVRLLDQLQPIRGRSVWMIPLVQLAIETAARQSELLALSWDDVDLHRAVLRIKGKKRSSGKSRTKNGERHRDVPLSSRARAILSGLPRNVGDSVFPISAQVVRNAFIQAVKRARSHYENECKKAKVRPSRIMDDLTFHDLRHEATSRLAEKLQLHELMKVTGHSSTRVLARYYHPRASELAKKLG